MVDMLPTPTVTWYRFTVDDYHRMAEAGILSEDDRVELIEGEVLHMAPIGGSHAACVNGSARLLINRLDDRAITDDNDRQFVWLDVRASGLLYRG